MKEPVFFHKGLGYGARSALQPPGSLLTCENILLEVDGDQIPRRPFTALNASPVTNSIHSVRRYEDYVLVGHGGVLSSIPVDTGVPVDLFSSFTSGAVWRWEEYKNFLHGVNGYEEVLFDEYGNLYPAEIANPNPPATSSAAADGTLLAEKFMCYVTLYVTFPNGAIYETGLSDGKEVDCTAGSKKISWAGIPVSSYLAHYANSWDAFNKTMTLLHFNGSQDSTTITDSTGRHTWTASGDANIDNAWDLLGTNSLALDGTGDYIAASDTGVDSVDRGADWNLSTGAFCIHLWVKQTTVPTTGLSVGFFGQTDDANNRFCAYWTNNGGSHELHLYAANASTVHHFHGIWTPVADTAYHLAFIRGWGGVTNTDAAWKITVDGTALTSVVDVSNPTVAVKDMAAAFEVGRAKSDASTVIGLVGGYLKEFVMLKGVTPWTANFDVPTTFSVDCSIRRKLYRGPSTGSTLSDIYWVANLYDNATTTFTDDNSAATLEANGPCLVDEYGPGPHSELIRYHYGRLSLLDKDKPWRLWYSEPAAGETAYENENIALLGFLPENYDDIRVSGFDKTEVMGIFTWGTNYYLALKHTWIRREGNDPDTWSWKKTYAVHGVCAKDSIALHKLGIFFLATNEARQTGIAVFNGQATEILTCPNFDWIFNYDLDPNYASQAKGVCVNNYYHLLYKSVDGDWKWLALDLRRLPDIRAAYWTHIIEEPDYPTCFDIYNQGYDETSGFSLLVGCSDGTVYYDDASGAVPFDIQTKDLTGPPEIMNDEKTLKEIWYNLDTQNEDVTLELYIDGAIATWADGTTTRTINGTEDKIDILRDLPMNFKGRFFRLRIYDDTGHATVHIYSPWTLIYDTKQV